MPRSAFDCYTQDVQRHDVMSREEEVKTALAARNGDRKAIDRLVACNQRFVIKIANAMIGRGVDLEDLVQEGNLGLIRAIQSFDPTRGFKLITYAAAWITQYMRNRIFNSGVSVVKFGTTQVQRSIYGALPGAIQRLHHKRLPETAENLAREIGHKVKASDIDVAISRLHHPDLSLDVPIGDDGEEWITRIADTGLLPDAALDAHRDRREIKALVQLALDQLDARERFIIEKRLMADPPVMTLNEVSAHFGFSRERARQLQIRGVRKLTMALKTLMEIK